MAPPVAPAAGATKADVRDQSALEQRLGQSTSVIMPLLELGAIGYVTWVFVYQICIQYLVDPSADLRADFNVQPRRATGIALIVRAWQRLQSGDNGRALVICSQNDQVRRVLEITGLELSIPVHTTRDEALAALSS